jgi:hypothetical protein
MLLGGPGQARQGHDAVSRLCGDAARVRLRELGEHLADIPGDVLVWAEVDGEQVTAAHDSGQLAADAAAERGVGLDHRQPFDVPAAHQPRGDREGRIRVDRDGRRGYQLCRGQVLVLLDVAVPVESAARLKLGLAQAPFLGAEQVGPRTPPRRHGGPVPPPARR